MKPEHGNATGEAIPEGFLSCTSCQLKQSQSGSGRHLQLLVGRMLGELVGSFQELLDVPSRLQQALLSQAVPSVEG